MPGIDDVDRQYRRRNPTAPTDGELAAERGVRQDCAAAAKAIGDETAQEGVLRWIKGQSGFVEGAFANFYCSEDGMKRLDQLDRDALLKAANEMAGEIVTLRAAANRSDLDAEDRREVRRQALAYATPALMPAGYKGVLEIAREFERYLLGDDADPPAKGRTTHFIGCKGGEFCDCDGRTFADAPPKPPAKME